LLYKNNIYGLFSYKVKLSRFNCVVVDFWGWKNKRLFCSSTCYTALFSLKTLSKLIEREREKEKKKRQTFNFSLSLYRKRFFFRKKNIKKKLNINNFFSFFFLLLKVK